MPGAYDKYITGYTNFRNGLQSNWQTSIFFGNGELPNSQNSDVNKIARAEANILINSKPGDQVMIFVGSAGFYRDPGEITHHINLTSFSRSLDHEVDFVDALRKKGVKVALIDFSCFNGATQAINLELARRDAVDGINRSGICIITAATATYYTLMGDNLKRSVPPVDFVANFMNVDIHRPITLEEWFLLKSDDQLNFSQISSIDTPETDWFNYWNFKTDPASIKRQAAIATGDCPLCHNPKLADKMIDEFDRTNLILDSDLKLKLEPYRQAIHDKIRGFYSLYDTLTNYLEAIYHLVSNPEIPPRFGDTPVAALKSEANRLAGC